VSVSFYFINHHYTWNLPSANTGTHSFLFFVTLFTAIYLKYGSSAPRAQAAANRNAANEEAKIGNDSDMSQAYGNA
jgi:hypothetical protein